MQGTWHVRSLVRLVLGAVLLCVAWILLSSTQAAAAERGETRETPPAKGSHASALLPVKAKPTRPAVPAVPLVPAVPHVPVAPAVARLEQVVAAAVPIAREPITSVKHVVVAAVPAIEKPVTRVEQVVVAVVDEVPVVGGDPVGLPLPGVGGTVPLPSPDAAGPIDKLPADPVRSVATQRIASLDPASTGELGTSRALPDLGTRGSSAGVAVPARGPSPTAPWPAPEPAPEPASLPPTSPSPGAGPGPSDPATAPTTILLPRPGVSGRDGADWRVPGSLPTHPGTRPD
jgi:hypothetical protein